jgi:hypothetical protein
MRRLKLADTGGDAVFLESSKREEFGGRDYDWVKPAAAGRMFKLR